MKHRTRLHALPGTLTATLIIVSAAACSRHDSQPPPVAAPPAADAFEPAAATPPPAEPAALMGTAWAADFIEGVGDTGNKESTLEFLPEGRVAGRGGCNRYGGPVEVKAESVTFGALMTTKMACEPAAIMTQEQKFLEALAATRTYRMDNKQLVLLDEAGAARVRLELTTAAGP